MKLLTKEIQQKLPKLYTTEGVPAENKKFICKFFTPWSNWTWYVVEGQYMADINDWEFFGLVDGHEKEWGYFRLSELEELKGPAGLRIERDLHFRSMDYAELLQV